MNQAELKQRTKQFGLRVMRLVDALPRSRSGTAIASQLVRSGTAVGANYRATCRARAKAEFAARIAVAEEEADESAYWIELIIDGALIDSSKLEPLHREPMELTAIMATSRITSMRNRKPNE